jgi:hypothetical protein
MGENDNGADNKSAANRLYVLENTTGDHDFLTLGTGQEGFGQSSPPGLFLPAAMAFGPDGAIYVSNVGCDLPPNGLGQILKINLP